MRHATNMRAPTIYLALAVATTMCVAPAAVSAVPNADLVCPEEPATQDRFTYLRSLSLHLRGVAPSYDEMMAIEALEDVPEETIDAWLATEEFAAQVVRYHRSLLWNNVEDINLFNAGFALRRNNNIYWRLQTALLYRGADVSCLDEPVVRVNGVIQTTVIDGIAYEGYEWVAPYWAPETLIKVCAFDAQEAEYGLSGVYCGSTSGRQDPTCGCGQDLRFCRYSTSQRAVTRSFGQDVDMRVEAIILEDAPYTDLFTSKRAFINGPMAFYYAHQVGVPANTRFDPLAIRDATLPDLEWTDAATWVETELDDFHAGILTSPAFLLRFQTNRARANRFYDAFLCQPFNAPSGGVEAEDTDPHPDLQQREGCKYCHALLEPASAHWGRWTESGAGYLNPERFPRERPDCVNCAYAGEGCSDDCNRFYLKDALSVQEIPYLGQLFAYNFRRDDHLINIEQGPELLVNHNMMDGDLPRCVSTRTAQWLLGRDLVEGEEDWVDELVDTFVSSGLRYSQLVKAIVTSDVYRRVR